MQITSIGKTEHFGAKIDSSILDSLYKIKRAAGKPLPHCSDISCRISLLKRLFPQGKIIDEYNGQRGVFLELPEIEAIPLTVKNDIENLNYSDLVEISNRVYDIHDYKTYLYF